MPLGPRTIGGVIIETTVHGRRALGAHGERVRPRFAKQTYYIKETRHTKLLSRASAKLGSVTVDRRRRRLPGNPGLSGARTQAIDQVRTLYSALYILQ